MNCKNCQTPLTDDVTVCPNCGCDNSAPQEADVQEKRPVNGKKLALVIGAVVLVAAVILAAIIWGGSHNQDSGQTTAPAGETLAPQETLEVQNRDSYAYQGQDAAPDMDKAIATMGQRELTNGLFNIFYWNAYYELSSQALAYGLDTTQPLSQQNYGTLTWEQFFIEQSLHNWSQCEAMAQEAEAKGFTLSAEAQEQIDTMEQTLGANAATYGFASLQEMLETDFGKGTTIEDYKEFMRVIMLGNEYYASLTNSISTTAQEVEAYFDENITRFTQYGIAKDDTPAYINVRHILIAPEGEKVTDETTGVAAYTEAQMADARAEAQTILDTWKSGEATEDSFAALAAEHTEDPGSKETGGLYEQVTKGKMVAEFDTWCFDAARQPGDTDLVETSYGVHIMYFVSKSDQPMWYAAAESEMHTARLNEMVQAILDSHPYEVDYASIVLTNVNTASAY